MSDASVSLELITRQYERMLAEMGSLRDDIRVLTAIVLRHDREFERMNETLAGILNQIREIVAQHQTYRSNSGACCPVE